MDSRIYRQFHESQMMNNNGTSLLETFAIITLPYLFAVHVVNVCLVLNLIRTTPIRIFVEFLAIVVFLVLSVTILNPYIIEITTTLFIATGISVAAQMRGLTHKHPFVLIPTEKPTYLSLSRSLVNLITAVCILAVDFKCFPRKLAKTETFGFGLMDVGVGLFVIINGLVSKEIPKFSQANLVKTVHSTWPLFLLGALRLATTTHLDYQAHVSEYGVHWNFFLTLAFTRIFGTIIVSLLSDVDHAKFVAIVIVTLYEMALQLGLGDYLLNNSRSNIIEANKEGIFSLFGYLAIYVSSAYLRHTIQSPTKTIPAKELALRTLKMALIGLCLWKMVHICNDMFGVSRRLANMGYVIWIVALATTMVALFMLLELFYYFIKFDRTDPADCAKKQQSYGPIILNAINCNGLFFFLAANLLTGAVNLSVQTMLVDDPTGIAIILGYMTVLCLIQTCLYVFEINLKFW